MSAESNQHSIEIDKLYQDDAVSILGMLKVGQSIHISLLDGPTLAGSLLEASQSNANVFLEAQSELIYGNNASRSHTRPNLTTAQTILSYLGVNGFESESTDNESLKPGYHTIIATKRSEIPRDEEAMTGSQLPGYTNDFYPVTLEADKRRAHFSMRDSLPLPRVLNIGSGSDPNKQLPHAINIDVSPVGNPDVVADGEKLPFGDGVFTVVMASHVLEHFPPAQIPGVIREWMRVLHPNGVLRIAVPDGEVTLKELISGTTRKGQPSYAMPGGSAPLTQLVGLGGENSKTDPRWRHQILFTKNLLKEILASQGLVEVNEYDDDKSLSYLCDVDMDETNSYSYKIEAQRERTPHTVSEAINEAEYNNLKATIPWGKAGPLSILIPVHNEEGSLPAFFEQLNKTLEELQTLKIDLETIFITNGCTDQSARLINDYLSKQQSNNVKLVDSQKGILNAFRQGLKKRNMRGLVSKIDIDTTFDYWTVPLMISELLSDSKKQVTYAEVRPLEDLPNRFNMAEFFQEFRTKRLYYHGRVSLYRSSPFDHFPEEVVANAGTLVEDMIFSCLYACYFGLESMGPAKGAFVKSAQPTSFDMGIRKFDRCRSEIDKIEAAFPQLRILSSVMKRVETSPPINGNLPPTKLEMWSAYHNLHQAMTQVSKLPDGVSSEVKEWERLR